MNADLKKKIKVDVLLFLTSIKYSIFTVYAQTELKIIS